jgi:hypothetical protein
VAPSTKNYGGKNMIEIILAFAAGLIIGWNVLPQPEWVKNIWTKIIGWFKPAA